MKILLTGACGYIGSHVCDLLVAENNAEILAVDNLSTGFMDAVSPSVKLYVSDISDSAALEKIFAENRIDAIMHFAGKISVPESLKDPILYYGTNTCNTVKLIDCASRYGVKYFIFSSTAAVYAQPETQTIIPETARVNPTTPYGASKLMSERIIQDTCRVFGIKYGILRYFNVAGADPEMRLGQRYAGAAHLIKMCCNTLLGKQKQLKIYGSDYPTPDGTGVRDYIHVHDLAQAHLSVLRYLQNSGESDIFNVGYSRGYSVLEIVKAIEEVSGKKLNVKVEERRSGDCAYIVSDNSKIRALTDWQIKYDDIKTIVGHAYKWECIRNSK